MAEVNQQNNNQNSDTARMKELVKTLNEAARVYYVEGNEIMSNFEYDRLYDELEALEKETGVVLSGSPTQRVGFEVLSELPKERHKSPMLSLDKTKSVEELAAWLQDKEGLLSWKMDGLTVVLTYKGGALQKAVTRGNGEIGEVITQNAMAFDNVPTRIGFKGEMVLRGEAIITYSEFQKINDSISDADAKYKNPRNLCSGSVRQLDANVTKSRHVNLMAFALVSAVDENGESVDFSNSVESQYLFMKDQGFDTVDYKRVDKDNIEETVRWFSEEIKTNDFPSDGLVLIYDDIAYGNSLGRTAKFPRNAIAFKWSDEQAETTLLEVEWSPSRTGLINPVAIFEPVELEGTTVTRASLHNISYCEDMELGIGDRITVYKANMIIPQIADNLTRSGKLEPAKMCPACGHETEIKSENEAKFLYCPNPECPAKKLKNFSLFVSRDALNVDGLSEQTLEKFIGHGFIHKYSDIFHMDRFRSEIIAMDGFGEKSYENLIQAAEKSSHTELYRVIYGLGIAGIGLANAKMLCRYFSDDIESLKTADVDALLEIDGIGQVLAENIVKYFKDEAKMTELSGLLQELDIRKQETSDDVPKTLEGMSVVITGSLNIFSNRKELQELIERAGGRAAGSVSAKTAYLVNNDITSTSGKNKKAKELGVPIVTEEDFIKILEGKTE
ncbi:DNA ligase (NAD(+)) LigA [Oribacterium sp. C9]|uniref:NAD-dependent DNA ligase LigA n=1 Tax=Oribacterium sp. C9 TaxID=1943579 RepID=UPI0009C95F70|nr:NAD-dependent DNA ligase LigA [Oribacterium sp. C9]OON85105.1 DNA ligase (NAD(+)) LigA [Oribacterium sp. C9]